MIVLALVTKAAKYTVVAVVLVSVLLVFLLPSISLEPTALRALRAAKALAAALVLAATAVSLALATSKPGFASHIQSVARSGSDLLDLNCTRLC